MAKFHPLKIAKIRKETDDCVSISFDIPEDLESEFRFVQGQHLTLKKTINDTDVSRSYSICSSPSEEVLRVAIKKVTGGQFSTHANDLLTEGETIEVMPPSGHFSANLAPDQENSYLMIAAGSGITPIISNIKAILEVEPKSRVTLFYGNRGSESIIFLEELEAIKNKYLSRFSVYHFFSRESSDNDLFNGRINSEKLLEAKAFIDYDSVDHAFICGPEEMMADTSEGLKKLGIPEDHIHLELFTSPVGKLGQSDGKKASQQVDSNITIILDGSKYKFPLDSKQSLLDVANRHGADLPFSCKGGVCSTCKAMLLEGEVEMTYNYALEPDEVKAGYILTCQSHPITENIVISFDNG